MRESDPESSEIDLPVTVDISKLTALIDEHNEQIKEIEASLPMTPIECGLFLVEVVSVRDLLLNKHKAIIQSILTAHTTRCTQINQYLENEFKKVTSNLNKRPENIEDLTALEEYIGSLPATIQTLSTLIGDMMQYQSVLDKYKHKIDHDMGLQLWSVFAAPGKIATKCEDVVTANLAVKNKFKEEMTLEQSSFTKTLVELSTDVQALSILTELNDVVNICQQVKDVEAKIVEAQSAVKVFNSRESLFEDDVTEYEEMNNIVRNFEPYLNLWSTAKDWIELSEKWMTGRFIDLNAEEVEKLVDQYDRSITKAHKFFNKADMETQATIAAKIKTQVQDFVPEVPMIVVLRNPGMRERHWEKIAEQLQVDILPIENFSTEGIIAMNLKESLELIQKIGETIGCIEGIGCSTHTLIHS